MQSAKHVRFTLGACLLCLFSVQTQSQSAETEAQDGGVLEEILVTARKRDENLQEVPVSVAALNEQDIENIGVRSMRDYANQIPNFFMVETQNTTFAFANVRGITQARNLDPSVAVVIDGVLATTSISMSQELFDVQQIEVYKGPQGALYGRNAMGGAINITTKKPSNDLEALVRAGGGNGNTQRFQASISGPLSENRLFARAAVSYYDTDGLRNNITVEGAHGDEHQNISGRGRLLWDVSDNLEVDFRASVSQDESSALGFIDLGPIWHETFPGSGISLGCDAGFFPAASPPCNAGVVTGGNIADLFVPGQSPFVGDPDNIGDDIQLQVNLNGIEERDLYNASVLINWDIPIGRLTSITSWDKAEDFAIGENPPRTAGNGQKNTQWKTSKVISQEVRLTSPDDQRLRWIAGFYVAQTDNFLSTTVQRDFDGIDSTVDLVKEDPFGTPSGICSGSPFFPLDGSNDNQGNCLMGFDGDEGDNFAWAVFSQFNYDLTETVELSFSARFDRDDREQTVRTPDSLFLVPVGFPNSVSFGDVRSEEFDSFQPKLTVRWLPQDGLTTYLSYAEGFRSGGFNRPGIQALADFFRGTPGIPPIPLGILDIYPQQDTQSLEAGVKFTSANGRFRLNAAAFRTNVDDYQTFSAVQVAGILSQVTIPVDEVEIDGLEVDVSWRLTDTLSVTGGIGLMSSEITKDSARGFVGNDAPMTPDSSINSSVLYVQPFTMAGEYAEFFLRLDYRRVGDVYFLPGNFAQRDPIDFFNLRFGLEFGDGWRVETFSKNLTDENYCASMFTSNGFCFPGKLREFGIEAVKRFGQ